MKSRGDYYSNRLGLSIWTSPRLWRRSPLLAPQEPTRPLDEKTRGGTCLWYARLYFPPNSLQSQSLSTKISKMTPTLQIIHPRGQIPPIYPPSRAKSLNLGPKTSNSSNLDKIYQFFSKNFGICPCKSTHCGPSSRRCRPLPHPGDPQGSPTPTLPTGTFFD